MTFHPLHRVTRGAPAGAVAVLALALASCEKNPVVAPSSEPALAAAHGTSDPTATWKIPLNATGLAFQSDGRYGDGTYSVYANGVCNVSATIFATAAGSNTGDATIQTSKPSGGKCGRVFTLSYPDGYTETLPSFNNLNQLENTTYSIPIGTTAARRLILAPGSLSNNPSRCGRLLFGPNGTVGVASDSILVTRVDARTWQVQSQAAPNDLAYCENNGLSYEMPVNFVVVSSVALP
jgi:hypothetical protein